MSILIIGGNGFLGAHVVRQLVESGKKVISLDINVNNRFNQDIASEYKQIQGDITELSEILSSVEAYDINCIVHLASIVTLATQNNPLKAYKLNVGGLLNALEIARILGISRFVYASSLAVYGTTPENEAVSETYPKRPVSLYGATKVFGEELCRTYYKNYSLEYAAIRFPAMWGPGQGQLGGKTSVTGSGKFADIIEMPARGETPKISGANQGYDLLYVKDAASLIISALTVEKLGYQAYNAGTGRLVAMHDIGACIKEMIPKAEFIFEDGFDYFSVPCKGPMDITRARKDLGYKPTYHLPEAVKDYLQYLKQVGIWTD